MVASPFSELLQEAHVVLIEKAHILDFITEHCNTLNAYTESKSAVFLRVDPAVFKDFGTYNACTEYLDPAFALAERAALAAAAEALEVDLAARLCVREVVGSELQLHALAVEFLCECIQSALEVGECDLLVDYKTLAQGFIGVIG